MNNVMLDIETMSTQPTAAIVAIGAVTFDTDLSEVTSTFYQNVSLNSCIDYGLTRDKATLDWWSREENKIARSMLESNKCGIKEALDRFTAWCGDDITPWGNPSTFDIAILENAFKAVERKIPWKFYNISCYRTLRRLFPTVTTPRKASLVKHNALDDAKYQAEHLLHLLRVVKDTEDQR